MRINPLVAFILFILFFSVFSFPITNISEITSQQPEIQNPEAITPIPYNGAYVYHPPHHQSPSTSPGLTIDSSPSNYSIGYNPKEFNSFSFESRKDLVHNVVDFTVAKQNQSSYIADIKEDSVGNIYVLGGFDTLNTSNVDIQSLITSYGNEVNETIRRYTGLLVKFSPAGDLLYGTLLDGNFDTYPGEDIVVSTMEIDNSGNIYVQSMIGQNVITTNNFAHSDTDKVSVYIMKLQPSGNDYIVSYGIIGGSQLDIAGMESTYAYGNPNFIQQYKISDLLELDSEGNLIIAGTSTSWGSGVLSKLNVVDPDNINNTDSTFGTHASSTTNQDIFISKLNSTDLTTIWLRYYSSDGKDQVGTLTLDDQDRIFIGGMTDSTTVHIPTGLSYPLQNQKTGGSPGINHQRTIKSPNKSDGFIAMFEKNGTLNTATFLGSNETLGPDADFVYDLDISGNQLWVVGTTYRYLDFPIVGSTLCSSCTWTTSGYLLSYDINDFNMTYAELTNPAVTDGFVYSEVEVQNDIVMFSGMVSFYAETIDAFYYDYIGNATSDNYLPVTGPYADINFSAYYNWSGPPYSQNPYGTYFTASIFGMMNTSNDKIFYTNIDFGQDHSTQARGSGRTQFLMTQNSDLYVGYESFNAIALHKLSIKDTDSDGISDWNEVNVYGTNPTISDTDGDTLLDGYEVYGINPGSFVTSPILTDTDNDCIDDNVELDNDLNPTLPDLNNDLDGDGINSYDEVQLGLNVSSSDTDGDGWDDFYEVFVSHTNGSNADSDTDGLNDPYENVTDPWNPDTDGDGLLDGTEYTDTYQYAYENGTTEMRLTNATIADTDGDGLLDGLEVNLYLLGAFNKTNPLMYDTDYDNISDYDELLNYGSNPSSGDYDLDGLNDSMELLVYFTDPSQADIDGDTLNDYDEVITYGTDPWHADIDGDTLNDYDEVVTYGTDPWHADVDGDGLNDLQEVTFGSKYNVSDSDGDLLPDLFEYTYSLNSSLNETYIDFDGDNITTYDEYLNGTHPTESDIDNDTLDDLTELLKGTDPWNNDTDGDGLIDAEYLLYHTSPFANDTDIDGLSDKFEVDNNYNATNPDIDNDLLLDGLELKLQTGIFNNDSDADGLLDGVEYLQIGSNPLSNDTDGDTLTDFEEYTVTFTSVIRADTDYDDLSDKQELDLGTDPFIEDTDDDGLKDGYEVSHGYEPMNNDTDGDTLLDGLEENLLGTNPLLVDTDGDGMPDDWEVQYMYLNNKLMMQPTVDDASQDYDEDGLTNLREYELGTDPRLADTDGGGLKDGNEIKNGLDPLDPTDDGEAPLGEKLKQGFQDNPAAGWGAIIASVLALFVFGQMLLSWYQKRGGNA